MFLPLHLTKLKGSSLYTAVSGINRDDNNVTDFPQILLSAIDVVDVRQIRGADPNDPRVIKVSVDVLAGGVRYEVAFDLADSSTPGELQRKTDEARDVRDDLVDLVARSKRTGYGFLRE